MEVEDDEDEGNQADSEGDSDHAGSSDGEDECSVSQSSKNSGIIII